MSRSATRYQPPKRAKTLDGIAVDDMSATEMAERNLELFKDAGVQILRNWDRRAPFVQHMDHGEWVIPMLQNPALDHLYRLRYPDGRIVYATEPYGLSGDAIHELASLTDEGWEVRIGQMPLWYPGRTTQVLISRAIR